MISPGKSAELEISEVKNDGYLLRDDNDNVAFLPLQEAKGLKPGARLKVFIYQDSKKNWLASTRIPPLQLGRIAALKAVSSTEIGAFMDWGLDKDLFVPKAEQREEIKAGRTYLVGLYLDEKSNRLAGSTKLGRFVHKDKMRLKERQEVQLLIWYPSDMGYNVIINQQYRGLLHFSDIHKRIREGDAIRGYIKKVREDGKVDVILQPEGYGKIEENAARILSLLNEAGGYLPINDKSHPEEIKSIFEMSKKTFKKAIGSLYKQRHIRIEEEGIRLL